MLALQAETADMSKLEESLQKWQRSALKAKRHADACYAEAQAKEEEAAEAAAQVFVLTFPFLSAGVSQICTGYCWCFPANLCTFSTTSHLLAAYSACCIVQCSQKAEKYLLLFGCEPSFVTS